MRAENVAFRCRIWARRCRGRYLPCSKLQSNPPLQNDAVFYFSDQIPLEAITLPDSRMEFDQFVRCWHSPSSTHERIERFVASPEMLDPDHATVRLEQNKISLVSHKAVSGMKGRAACFSGKVNGADQVEWFLLQIDFSIGTDIIEVKSRSSVEVLAEMALLATHRLLSSSHI